MENGSALRHDDVRSLLRLRGEAGEQLSAGIDPTEHVLSSLMSLTRASVALELCLAAGPGRRFVHTHWRDYGWASESDRRRATTYYASGPLREDPLLDELARVRPGVSVMNRMRRVSRSEWEKTILYNEVYRLAELGDSMMSFRPISASGEYHVLFLKRASRERPFGDRELSLIELFHGECTDVFDGATKAASSYARRRLAALTPRERETLALLLSAASPKEIAVRLGLTLNTTNGYVKLIYKKLGVQSRPELMARYRTPMPPPQ